MDDQKYYIIVDNETYELYDGNGSFYVTKAARPADINNMQNKLRGLKESSENSLVENLTVPVPAVENTGNYSTTQHQQLEPIIIDDYGNMNYFTQAASDVTIYLNSNNENNFMQNTSSQCDYFVDSNGVIDLTKMSNTKQNTGIPEKESTVDLNNTLNNLSSEELDAPEYIDISKLKPSYSETNDILNRINYDQVNSSTDDMLKLDSDDDEVIFVREFKTGNKSDSSKPLDLRRRCNATQQQKTLPPPRRNPKRQVQLIKQSFDLALKLSDEEIYWGAPSKNYKDYYMETSRRSGQTTGAVHNPPIALTSENYKEWPTEGLHERPVYNMATQKIDKFDFRASEEKRKTPVKKNNGNAMKVAKGKKTGKKGKRKATNKTNKVKKEPAEKGISKEFAMLTHETLQEVIKYVSQVKEYNEIRKGNVCDTVPCAETDNIIDDAKSLLELVRSNSMEDNLSDAVDLLTDSCILYSLANDVCQRSVATYLKSVNSS